MLIRVTATATLLALLGTALVVLRLSSIETRLMDQHGQLSMLEKGTQQRIEELQTDIRWLEQRVADWTRETGEVSSGLFTNRRHLEDLEHRIIALEVNAEQWREHDCTNDASKKAEESTQEQVAEEVTLEALQASAYPILLYEELPESARETFAEDRGKALFLKYPPNEWGQEYYGCVSYRVRDEKYRWRRVPLEETNIAALQKLAENAYDVRAVKEERILRAIHEGRAMEYASDAEAMDYLNTLTGKRPHMRVDPVTGKAWIVPLEQVYCAELTQLLEEHHRLGDELLAGSSGYYGAHWVGQ